MPDREIVGRNLRAARENCSITQQAAAEHLGLSRSLIAQIELGNRPVSPDELARLGEFYGQSIVDLVGERSPGDDDLLLVLVDLAPELLGKSAKARVTEALDLCREAALIEKALGRSRLNQLPHFSESLPRTLADALTKGERAASDERRRLGIGGNSIDNLLELVRAQGIRCVSVELPPDIAGVFLVHESVGVAIWTNVLNGEQERRHTLALEYGHVLLDRERAVGVTRRGNAGDLVEKRANAFASAFLLPAGGLRAAIESLDKGQGSRQVHVAFDELRQAPVRAESRPTPRSQSITYVDICILARRFRVSYLAVVHRLRGLDLLSDTEVESLLGPQNRAAAERMFSIFGHGSLGRRSPSQAEALDLKFEVVSLAVEAYRRGVVDGSRLERVASKLRLPQLSSVKLLELADAAR